MDDLYNTIYKSDAWLNASDEEYTKVIAAVRNFKIHGNPRPKIETIYKKMAENNEHASVVSRPVYENEQEEIIRVVEEYKKSPEYQSAYERFIKEDPTYLRQLEYQKVKETVRNFKKSREMNISEKEIIDDYMKRKSQNSDSTI